MADDNDTLDGVVQKVTVFPPSRDIHAGKTPEEIREYTWGKDYRSYPKLWPEFVAYIQSRRLATKQAMVDERQFYANEYPEVEELEDMPL